MKTPTILLKLLMVILLFVAQIPLAYAHTPPAPTGLTVTVNPDNSITLTWSLDQDVEKYAGEWGTDPNFSTKQTFAVEAPTTSFTTSPGLSPGTYYFRVKAGDFKGPDHPPPKWSDWSITVSATIASPPPPPNNPPVITPPNNPPVITSFTASPPSPQYAGTLVILNVEAYDPEGDPLEYRFSTDGGLTWTDWGSNNTYCWSTTAADRGLRTLKAQVRDGINCSVYAPDISYEIMNNPPVITSFTASPPDNAIVGTVVTLTVVATDADDDPLQYRFSTNGGVTWTPWGSYNTFSWATTVDNKGYHILLAQVRDTYDYIEISSNAINYHLIYAFGRFLPPLGSTFMAGRTIPVKFQLTDVNGNFITTAVAQIWVNNNPGQSSGASNIGNYFRYDLASNQYIFNLSTRNMQPGNYVISVTLDDETTYSITIRLR